MEMPFPPASPPKSFEEVLCQCWTEVSRKKNLTISCDQGAGMEAANSSPTGYEASPSSRCQRGSKNLTPRGSIEKMGPRHGPIVKHPRQQRQTSKVPPKIYSANLSNFKDLVFEHTSMPISLSMGDVAAQPTSPLTPQSNSSSLWGMMSQPSSPATPHSIQSSTASPLPSPQSGYPKNGTSVNSLQPLYSQSIPLHDTRHHFSKPYTHPHHNSADTFNHNTEPFYQSNWLPRWASTPEIESVLSDDGYSPKPSGGEYSWDYPPNMSPKYNLMLSPRSYEKQLSMERAIEDFMRKLGSETLANNPQ